MPTPNSGDVDHDYHRGQQKRRPTPALSAEAKANADAKAEAGRVMVDQVAAAAGTDTPTFTRERPGMSAFAMQDGKVFHTYSAYARGLDALWGMYSWLDRAPLGRNETGIWWRRHDEYGAGGDKSLCCGRRASRTRKSSSEH